MNPLICLKCMIAVDPRIGKCCRCGSIISNYKSFLIILITVFLLTGCSTQKEIITEKKETLTAEVPPIGIKQDEVKTNIPDTVYNNIVDSFTDTSKIIVEGETESGSYNVIIKKGKNKEGKPVLQSEGVIKPNPVTADYIKSETKIVKEPGFFEKLGNYLRYLIIGVIVIFIIALIIKLK